MPTRGSKDPNGRALRGRRAHTTFALLTDPARQIWNSFNNRANAGGADAPEAAVNGCLYDRFKSLYTKTATKPSLVIVPARFKSGTLYSQIPSSNADFTVTRALNTATRFDSSALIQTGITSGVPRLDYYTSGGVTGCPALLVEPAGTNGILNSTDTTTSWTLGPNLSRATIDVIGVSGTNLTVNATGNLGSDGRISRSNNNFSLVSGSTYTISFFIKKTGTHTIGGYYTNITGAAGGDLAAGFDVSGSFNSGSIYGSAGITNRTRRVEQWGTDVFRCSETFTMTASGTLSGLFLAPIVSVTNPINSANGTQLGFAAPQVELGSVPTSFIPTTAASGSRSADAISVTGAVSGSIGQQQGTLYAEVDLTTKLGGGNGDFVAEVSFDTNTKLLIRRQDGSQLFEQTFKVGGTNVFSRQLLNLAAGVHKFALAYKSGDNNVYVDGSSVLTGAASGGLTNTFFITNAMNRVDLGHSSFIANTQFKDRIRAVALYNTRLTNDELQSLTQP